MISFSMRADTVGRALTQTLIGAAIVAAITVAVAPLQSAYPVLREAPLTVLSYFLAVIVTAQFESFFPGALAAGLALLCYAFVFVLPRADMISVSSRLLSLAIFLAAGLILSRLLGRARRRSIEAEQREREAMRFYELSLALISSHDAQEIATVLASRLGDALGARVEVSLRPEPQSPPVIARAPEGSSETRPAEFKQVIQSARGEFGEIRLWREAALTPGEDRLLRTFAGETALVAERLRASQAETRAAVLEESDRLKTALLGAVSHELRTPLSTIRANVEGLASGLILPGSDNGHEMLEDAREATLRLSRLVDNMLDMSRIETGALRTTLEWVDVSEVINAAALRMRGELGRHTLDIDVAEDLPLAPADSVQLDQVFTNLISNSVKYSAPNTAIRIEARPTSSADLRVRVLNQSPGLPPGDLPRIFEKFYRVTQAHKIGGTGLGLSICKGIIDAHGGRIWAENLAAPGEPGFAFLFTLPLTWNGAAPRLPPPETS